MAKRPVKKKQADHQQLARKVLDAVAPDAEAKQDTTQETQQGTCGSVTAVG
jgi:hypothetical protein